MLLMRQRRIEESVQEAQATLHLAPVSARFEFGLTQVMFYAGRHREALEAGDRAIAIDSSYVAFSSYYRAWVNMFEKRFEEALTQFTACNCVPEMGYVHAKLKRNQESLKLIGTLKAGWQQRRGRPEEDAYAMGVAGVLTGLGKYDEAITWLERAAVPGTFIVYAAIDPSFTELHSERRFQALLHRIGLDRHVRPRQIHPEAFEYYLKGTQSRYKHGGLGDFSEAMKYYMTAIERDSTYAPPYAGLAFVHAMSRNGGLARQYAAKALELDPSLAEAHIALGMVRQMFDWNWSGAENSLREAIRLNPGHPEAHHELSMLLMRQQRLDDAVSEAQMTLQLAPSSARFEIGMAEVMFYSRRFVEALEAADRAAAIDSGYAWSSRWFKGWIFLVEQRFREAIKEWETCNCSNRLYLGYLMARTGRSREAHVVLDGLKAEWRRGRGSPGEDERAIAVATVLMGLSDHDQALVWLERAVVPGTFIVYLGINPIFAPLHNEPRFQALLQKIRLGGREAASSSTPEFLPVLG
jgi:tetratricopeptide (TPR) repeat protein